VHYRSNIAAVPRRYGGNTAKFQRITRSPVP